ncbi:MAG: sigma-70 family RNA polymerase sigma factor [Tannerellaceae bacterium]|jgi:RNA polymerase sigma-70 factor (ECF subfamily)|nr:sigma-70 family RNA polymerase sigma factor [Tannerellaceae bacterium]
MNERQLIDGCKKGNRLAQKELYDKYSRKMMGVCMRYFNDKETARDVLQEGFVKLFLNINSFLEEGPFEAWMRKIFVNSALEHLRRVDILKEAASLDNVTEQSSAPSSPLDDLREQELLKMVQNLPTGFRTVFNLFAIEGYSHKEIAEMLGITESTSRSQYTRARQLLQKRIKEEDLKIKKR